MVIYMVNVVGFHADEGSYEGNGLLVSGSRDHGEKVNKGKAKNCQVSRYHGTHVITMSIYGSSPWYPCPNEMLPDTYLCLCESVAMVPRVCCPWYPVCHVSVAMVPSVSCICYHGTHVGTTTRPCGQRGGTSNFSLPLTPRFLARQEESSPPPSQDHTHQTRHCLVSRIQPLYWKLLERLKSHAHKWSHTHKQTPCDVLTTVFFLITCNIGCLATVINQHHLKSPGEVVDPTPLLPDHTHLPHTPLQQDSGHNLQERDLATPT